MGPKYPCIVCEKCVKWNQNAILCAICDKWIHLKCSSESSEFHRSTSDWICNVCLMSELPFPTLNDNDEDHSFTADTTPVKVDCDGNTNCTHTEDTFSPLRFFTGLIVAHLNVCSLFKNIEEIRHILTENHIHILCLCETRLDDSITNAEMSVHGYRLVRRDRNRNGGGVIVYIHESIDFCERKDLNHCDNFLEILCIQIKLPHQKPFIIVLWYRPPDCNISVFDSLEDVLQNVEATFLDYILIGDINCDLLQKDPSYHTKRLIQVTQAYNLHQHVDKPTRVTQSTSTLIDCVFTSNSSKVEKCEVIHVTLSDHYMVALSWGKVKSSPFSNHAFIYKRDINKMDHTEFSNQLQSISWDDVLSLNDAEEAYSVWASKFKDVLDTHAPIRKKRVRHRKSPWMNKDILDSMRKRDRYKRIAKRSRLDNDWLSYKKMRNNVNSMIRKAKRSYIGNSIVKHKGNSSEMWKLLRYLIPNKKTNSHVQKLITNGVEITNNKSMANIFNEYFTQVAESRKQNVKFLRKPEQFLVDINIESTFEFSQVSECDIESSLQSIPSNKATGLDALPCVTLKSSLPFIVKPLTHIVNMSLKGGIVPSEWKRAKITPLLKGGEQTNPMNYRPISVLCVLSKVLEKIVFKQVYKHLENNDILISSQYGFRPNYSTALALFELTENIRKAIDTGHVVALVTKDLGKAFDMLSHDILIRKLKYYGFSDTVIKWFSDYFHLRRQVTTVNGNESTASYVKHGVPQGSILGPLLFILYLNDLPRVVKHCKISLYADDTCVYIASKDPQQLEEMLNEDLSSMCKWFSHNELLLNAKKCKLILFGTKKTVKKFQNINIHIDGCKLEIVDEFKYLGVILDKHLTWGPQLENVKTKILRNFHVLRRTRPFIDKNIAIVLYNTMVQSYLDYCNVVWLNLNSRQVKQLQTLQNRALRLVLNVDNRYHRRNLYDELNIDCIDVRVKKSLLILIFKMIHHIVPEAICTRISFKENLYNLRNHKCILNLDKPRSSFIKNSSLYNAIKLFNTLPESLRTENDINKFTRGIAHIYPLPF